ncbi:S-adenosyl-L-methionine-dependent methyltransferase, partial [Basidiobolus meristosporus CBS 931.73]
MLSNYSNEEEPTSKFEEVPYVLPNNIAELSRLNIQHYIFRYVRKGNYGAPISKDVKRILDVGCGTGIWAKDMSLLFPDTMFDGIDVNGGIDPENDFPNFTFTQGDILKGLPYKDNTFDFVYQRLLVAGMPATAWPKLCAELIRVVKPGGWIEIIDTDIYFRDYGPAWKQLEPYFTAFMKKRGIDPYVVQEIPNFVKQGGLSNIHHSRHVSPMGISNSEIDKFMVKDLSMIFANMMPLFVAASGKTEQQISQLLKEFEKECFEYKTYGFAYYTWGQKPL